MGPNPITDILMKKENLDTETDVHRGGKKGRDIRRRGLQELLPHCA